MAGRVFHSSIAFASRVFTGSSRHPAYIDVVGPLVWHLLQRTVTTTNLSERLVSLFHLVVLLVFCSIFSFVPRQKGHGSNSAIMYLSFLSVATEIGCLNLFGVVIPPSAVISFAHSVEVYVLALFTSADFRDIITALNDLYRYDLSLFPSPTNLFDGVFRISFDSVHRGLIEILSPAVDTFSTKVRACVSVSYHVILIHSYKYCTLPLILMNLPFLLK